MHRFSDHDLISFRATMMAMTAIRTTRTMRRASVRVLFFWVFVSMEMAVTPDPTTSVEPDSSSEGS